MSLQKTTKELIFELGNRAQRLTMYKTLGVDINVTDFWAYQRSYDAFKSGASILEVTLPDLTEDTLSDQFITAQVTKVQDYIMHHETWSMLQLYRTGKAAESIELFLHNTGPLLKVCIFSGSFVSAVHKRTKNNLYTRLLSLMSLYLVTRLARQWIEERGIIHMRVKS